MFGRSVSQSVRRDMSLVPFFSRHDDINDRHDHEEKDESEDCTARAEAPLCVPPFVFHHLASTLMAALLDSSFGLCPPTWVLTGSLGEILTLLVLVKHAEAALAPSLQASTAPIHWPHAVACAHVLALGIVALKIGVVCLGELPLWCHWRIPFFTFTSPTSA